AQRILELDLVPDRNAMRARQRQLGLQGATLVDRVAVPRDPLPPRSLVEPDRVRVVVGRDQPEPSPTLGPRFGDHPVEERSTGPRARVGGHDDDEFAVSIVDAPERAADRPTVTLDSEAFERRRVFNEPAARDDARGSERTTYDFGHPRLVRLLDA